jgi:hypothetical protein
MSESEATNLIRLGRYVWVYSLLLFVGQTALIGMLCTLADDGCAAMESFFSTLKTERLSKKHYRTRDDLRADVFDYIERFYNPRRRHSTIGYISPVQFEKALLRKSGSASAAPVGLVA